MAKIKKQTLTQNELLAQALVPKDEQPYEIPDNWVWVRLGNIITIKSGTTLPLENECEIGDVLYIKVSDMNLDENQFEIKTSSRYINDYLPSQLIPQKSILFPKRGGAIFTNKKRITNIPILADLNIMAITPCIADFMFTYYWFLSVDLSTLNNGSNIPQINNKDIEPLTFPFPPITEQYRIVERIENLFEKLDPAKELVQNALDSFETRKAAILHKAFSGELTAKWRKENGVGMESWEERRLGELCNSFQYGTSKKSEQSGDIVVVRMGNLQNGEINWDDLAYTVDEEDIKKYLLFEGDVLFNRTNSPELVGKTSVYRGEIPAIFAGYLIRINYNECLNGYYLNYVMNSQKAKEYCSSVKSDGVNQSNINAKKLAAFTIPYCSIEEQHEIVCVLDNLFEKEQRARELCDVIENIDLMKKAILARAFRGELGTNDPSEESAAGLVGEEFQE